jgi:rhomboid-like protein
MNHLWPAASRISCLGPRAFPLCHKFDSLAARLLNRTLRPYSISSLPFRRKKTWWLAPRTSNGTWQSNSYKFQHAVRLFASRTVITKYDRLPPSYKDEDGLSFRTEPLSQDEATVIFGQVIDVGTANRLLRVMHGRRVAGTLEDPSLANTSMWEQRAQMDALAWLRKNVPVDEVLCAGMRAERELAEMEADIVSDAQRLGLHKPDPEMDYRPNSGERKNIYGDSALDAIREAKEKELDEMEARQNNPSQADEIRENTGTLEKLSARSRVELRRKGENPKLKYYLERAKVLPDTPPEMSTLQRLLPSGLVVLGLVIGCYTFTQVYTPPRPAARMWPDMPPSAATIIGIIIANSIVLGAWRVPPLFRMLNKFFITVPGYPRALSLIGNNFSHQSFSHFAVNMTVLWFVGTRLHDDVGRANFLAIYLSCGAVGSFASLTSWVLRKNWVSSSLGASGAVSGIIAAYLFLNGSEKVTLFGVFPPENWPSISAMGFLILLISLDIIGLTRLNKVVSVDHWAHLGGYASGIAAAEMLNIKARERKALEAERRKNMGVIDRIREGKM